LFARYLDGVDTVSARDIEEAIEELKHSPAQALVVNTSPLDEDIAPLEQLISLPHAIPAITCWVPGDNEAARRLGVTQYLVKPVDRDILLTAVESVGEGVKQILLVDDEREVLQLFSRVLSSAERGYQVLWASSGQMALSLLRERHPDVVLLDLLMPQMDGFQVIQEKNRDPAIREIPVIVVSSRDPGGAPITSDKLTVTRGGGLSAHDLLACIEAVSKTLAPSAQSDDPERSKSPAA
jgi:CheY-like chemotaxis protein